MTTSTSTLELLHDSLDDRTRLILQKRSGTSVLKRRGWLVRRTLLVIDLVGLTVSFGITQLIYERGANAGRVDMVQEWLLYLLSLPLWVVMAKLYGLYDRDEERADHSTADEVIGVFHLVTIGTWILFVGAFVTRLANPEIPKLITFWLVSIATIPLIRSVGRAWCRRSIYYLQNTLIIGAGDVGQQVARKLLKHPEYGMNLVGFVDGSPKGRADDLEHLTLLGDLDQACELVELLDVERVIVAFSNDSSDDLISLIRELNQLNVQVDVVPRFFDVLTPAADLHTIEGLPLVGLRPPHLPRSSAFLKRSLDVIGALAGIVLLAPVWAVVAIAIKLDSPGPVFFRQVRMGTNNNSFEILKFRTMVEDAEDLKSDLTDLNKHALSGDASMFKIDDDPRVTRVGRVLRRFSIDELPQFWNVLNGEMSLVGPRPLILDEHAHVVRWALRRLDLKPGMTGLWQVLGRDDIPFHEMVKLDYLYVTSWSLGGDVRLLFKTIPLMLNPRTVAR